MYTSEGREATLVVPGAVGLVGDVWQLHGLPSASQEWRACTSLYWWYPDYPGECFSLFLQQMCLAPIQQFLYYSTFMNPLPASHRTWAPSVPSQRQPPFCLQVMLVYMLLSVLQQSWGQMKLFHSEALILTSFQDTPVAFHPNHLVGVGGSSRIKCVQSLSLHPMFTDHELVEYHLHWALNSMWKKLWYSSSL